MSKGKVIAVCGIDGSGKTTTVEYIKNTIDMMGLPVIKVHSLSTVEEANNVYNSLKEKSLENQIGINRVDQAIGDYIFLNFLFKYETIIKPAINEGVHVVCDRFIYSHIANQRAFDVDTKLYEAYLKNIEPDLTLFLSNTVGISTNRIKTRKNSNKIERNKIMLEKISYHLQNILKNTPHIKVNSNSSIDYVENEVKKHVIALLGEEIKHDYYN
ncbi:dTMP kinase [Bacillus cereus]|uniref:Thymidylate kinase n=1 Tax=Bacillus cereus TaxID=1396 RepID=A0A9X8NTR0_BACCE|nr:deoxynucleoside kinase [Bacillus cereus]RWQ71105.1 hypothetical protein DR116_0024935 [Bacillus cereus]